MDKRLQLIAHLYDEDLEGLEPLGSLLEDPDLRAEYEAMGETRFGLEHRERVRPDARLIDAVVSEALRSRPAPVGRPMSSGRTPLRLVRSARFWVPAMSIAASVLLVVLVKPWTLGSSVSEPDALAESFPPAEKLLESLPPAPPAITPVNRESTSEPASLDWDTGSDVRHLSRRIERLRAAGLDGWDTPAVPLEALPTGGGTNGLLQTGSGRPNQ